MKSKHRLLWGLVYLIITVIVAAPFLFQVLSSSAVDAALAAAIARGEAEQQLQISESKDSNAPLGGWATVLLRSNADDEAHTIEVQLRRPMWSPYWRVDRYGELAADPK